MFPRTYICSRKMLQIQDANVSIIIQFEYCKYIFFVTAKSIYHQVLFIFFVHIVTYFFSSFIVCKRIPLFLTGCFTFEIIFLDVRHDFDHIFTLCFFCVFWDEKRNPKKTDKNVQIRQYLESLEWLPWRWCTASFSVFM